MDEALKLKRATYHLWTFTISKLISSFGAQVYAFAISFYILQQTGSATSFATNLICNILPRTLVAPFAGYMADRYSRKAIVITAQIATSLAIMGLLAVSLTWGLSLISIYITTSIIAITSTFSGVAFTSSITGLVDETRIQRAMSMNQMSLSFAAIGSPALGGLLYGTVTMPVFLIMFITASTIAIILESTMNFKLFAKRKEVEVGEPKESMLQSMKAGISYLKLHTILLTIVWFSFVINFLFGAFEVGYSFVLIEKLKIASEHFGFTQGAFAVGMLLASVYLSVRKEIKFPIVVGKRGVLGMGSIIGFIAIPLLFQFPYYGMFTFYILLMFSLGVIMIIVNTPIQVMLQKIIDDDYKGRVFSILETMAMALMPLGMVIFGFLFDKLPAEWILISSSVLLATVVLIMLRPSIIRKIHPEIVERQAITAEATLAD